MRNYLVYFYHLVLMVIVVLSGFLGMGREIMEMIWPDRAPRRKRLWNFIIIAFIISASILWYQEHQEVVKLRMAAETDFKGTIDKVLMSPIDKNGSRYVLFFVAVENDGAPSIVKDYYAKAIFNNTHEINLIFEMIPEKGLNIRDRVFYPLHAIYEITKSPVTKRFPRYGVILFLLKDAYKFKEQPHWHLTFTDYSGKEYAMKLSSTYEENILPFRFKKVDSLFISSPSPHFTGSAPK